MEGKGIREGGGGDPAVGIAPPRQASRLPE